jgi:hypothetical protein
VAGFDDGIVVSPTPPAAPLIAPPVAPPAAIETAFPRILLEAPGEMISPVPRDPRAEGADLFEMILSDLPDIPGGKALRLEDLFSHPSAVERDRIPGGGDYGPMVIRSPGPRRNRPPRRPLYLRPLFLAVAISILLLGGGVLYFGATEAGQELLGKWFPSWGSAPKASAAARPAYDVREMKSTAYEKAVAGNLFVISGTVVNVGKGTRRGIQMRAALLGEDNQVLMENSSLAGNLIYEPTLRHMNRGPIEVYLKMENRAEGERRDILPGKSLPFLGVFFDPPGKIGSFAVHAVDAD